MFVFNSVVVVDMCLCAHDLFHRSWVCLWISVSVVRYCMFGISVTVHSAFWAALFAIVQLNKLKMTNLVPDFGQNWQL